MEKTHSEDSEPVWNVSAEEWAALTARAQAQSDVLEDGAFVRAEVILEVPCLVFYATPLNKPDGWGYPFLEDIAGVRTRGAEIGRAWHAPDTGFVQFAVALIAAAQALAADYESGASDLDWVTYEQAVAAAVEGTPADAAWLRREFARLVQITGQSRVL